MVQFIKARFRDKFWKKYVNIYDFIIWHYVTSHLPPAPPSPILILPPL
jgi:uncharacterized protein with HEPN domain